MFLWGNYEHYQPCWCHFRAWASSAPLTYFKDSGHALGAFDAVTKKTFLDAGCNEEAIVQGFNAIHELGQSRKSVTPDLGQTFILAWVFCLRPHSCLGEDNASREFCPSVPPPSPTVRPTSR